MKILHILEATQGGTRRHVLDLLPALVARGVACDLVYSPDRHPPFRHDAEWLRARGVNCFEMHMARGWGGKRDAATLLALRAHLKTHRYDAMHCHSTKAGFLGRLVAPRRLPVVYTPHCIAFDTSLPRAQRRAARVVEKLLAPRTRHFIAVSRHEARIIYRVRLCDASRLSVIYNGVDLNEFDHLTTSPPHHPTTSPPFIIGCFGRLTRQKYQAALLCALPALRRAVPEAHLLLVGSGEDEARLRALAEKLHVSKAVTFAGEIEEARPLYADCHIVAQPSRWEGCPYSILEAMAARRATVATAVGGVPEVLTPETGIVYHPTRPDVLAEHLVALAQGDAWREKLGQAARRRIEEHFEASRMVAATARVYESFAAGA